ncbi:MAG: carbohydrate ABC transporter permease, partial [Chloroflexi bacterium]|nr:carbohydrate ABC transporter permease [Chloroflexota bacterium]
MRKQWRLGLGNRDLPFQAVLVCFGIVTFFPMVLVVITSLKSNTQFYHNFWLPELPFQLGNYSSAFRIIWRYIVNSVLYSGSTICLIAVIASVAGYVFARFRFPFKTVIFLAFITLIMVPGVLTLAPRFVLVRDLGMVNTPLALISVWVSGGLVLSTWLMRSYFESLPQELFDAAYVDGAAEWQVFTYVSVPLARPMIATVAMTTLIGTWNDLIWPLVTITDKSKMPLAQGLMQFSSAYETDWGTLFAG